MVKVQIPKDPSKSSKSTFSHDQTKYKTFLKKLMQLTGHSHFKQPVWNQFLANASKCNSNNQCGNLTVAA